MAIPPFLVETKHKTAGSQNPPFHRAEFTHTGLLGLSHVLWWPTHDDNEPDTILFFIPGNPGLVDFYIPFLSEIHDSHVSSNFAILAQSHLDHYPGIRNNGNGRYQPGEYLTIQVQNSLELLEAVDNFYDKKPRIILIGHSVGCWISLQVLKSLPEDRIEAAFLLFPTISNIGDTPNGKSLFPIFWPASRSILASLSLVARYLPTSLLPRVYSSWPKNQLNVLQDFIHSRTSIYASLSMGAEEMKTIRDLDIATLNTFKDRLYFYYAKHDRWVGREREVVLQALNHDDQSNKIYHGPDGIPHAFCINHSEPVAKQCCEWIQALSERLEGQTHSR